MLPAACCRAALALTVGDVDAGGDAAAREREHLERGEVRPEERVLLVGGGPRQQRQQVLGAVHQLLEPAAHLLVHHRHEACSDDDRHHWRTRSETLTPQRWCYHRLAAATAGVQGQRHSPHRDGAIIDWPQPPAAYTVRHSPHSDGAIIDWLQPPPVYTVRDSHPTETALS